ncbi:MAG: M57 family metalloprotease [Bacteroidota bacterium]
MMKKLLSMVAIGAIGTILSCQTDDGLTSNNEVSADALAKIAKLGFSTEGARIVDGAYLVEGDIMLHDHDLNSTTHHTALRIAEVEQYRTFNLVSGLPRTITVSSSGQVNSAVSSAINSAIGRYNAENLGLTFVRVSSGGDINIRMVNGGGYIASAGFPSGGDPYPTVKFNRQYQNYSSGFLTTVIAHEMGHCIGFRHTDYMDRSYSCGSGGNEGSGTVGAVHIPGTPTGPDSGSWMLACLSSTTNRPFNNNDKTALNYLY